ncbi:UDP-4-amino-4,6-dideoxy-N-acetyl-beta-L-altrosamine transaminase [Brevibacillus agri]|uniref:UDP-4-amino-4, 6-dideoxy-N-acetyl-beta-L-altrosamine transaminase n=1 Tax=Brevibacillus agri TaxID=51101 RepID=UPI002E1E726E|nr:UDP-4-amino-4,6-dideoxy-N-acetyl-beta-L-altrosamine transaminase [Brevibacillus agri]MED1642038.1 UDP-4-amino-4,6-dideoxy-N-acetyl-beta-L-altrosamine transaminase [Brevibacillus agri]MED1655870.1 UDP-4-amino-4,6-dideoxy-N-acetyl-beta-L-altrosamine transaminase [Brevibacillus agri]MED1685021.1 UDP-4-amino-4,6-dideoxy-N-acetyl-beta-L-altrosamine transaminase [Brevibacillus agri]MED1693606.1 UDP-4-amino-4,6-dideoxy-N-acetyl-beta-L-altrosamine transaminase [Brevibacillus agri]MED1697580.1 UDP-4
MDKLALYGGTPVRECMLSYGSQWINDDDIEAVVKTLKSPHLTQGPKIVEFEKKIADRVKTKYAVAFCNGTAALHAACFAANIGSGDEVITTPLTFAASSNCVLYQGGVPVFADVNKDTYLIDFEKVKSLITPRTKAIIPVDFTGQPIDMVGIMKIAKEHGLIVIQDGAHSLGGYYGELPVGNVADMTMFSFHPVKPLTTGEGGIIVTNNLEYYEKLVLFRSHGITRNKIYFVEKNEGAWYYEMQELGYNYRMTDIQATLGLSQLNRLDSFMAKRNKIAEVYDQAFASWEKRNILKRPKVSEMAKSGWHLYIIQLNLDNLQVGRDEIFNALRAENIGVNVHYMPVYLHPYYQRLGYNKGLCPVAEKLFESFITLPIFPKMSQEDIESVITAMSKVLSTYATPETFISK